MNSPYRTASPLPSREVRAEACPVSLRARAAVLGAVVGLLSAVAIATTPACNATTDQIHTTENDGMKLAGCVLGQIFGGNTDPGVIAGQCAGALPNLIVDIIDDFKAKAPDAGIAQASISERDRLLGEAKQKAIAALSRQASGK